MALTIRAQIRSEARSRPGLDPSWTEWQVVDRTRVVSRHDTLRQAQDAADRLAVFPDKKPA